MKFWEAVAEAMAGRVIVRVHSFIEANECDNFTYCPLVRSGSVCDRPVGAFKMIRRSCPKASTGHSLLGGVT